MGSLAAETRTAVDEAPFIRDGLRAGVVNFAAAARFLDVKGDEEAIATALRRYAEELPPLSADSRDLRVQMQSDVEAEVLQVDGVTPAMGDRAVTAILATGDPDAALFGNVLSRLAAKDLDVIGAGLLETSALVLVPRRQGATALRLVEQAAERSN